MKKTLSFFTNIQVGCHSRPGSLPGVNSSGNPVSFLPEADSPLAERIGKERHWIPAHAHSAEKQAECVLAGMTSFKKKAANRLPFFTLLVLFLCLTLPLTGCIGTARKTSETIARSTFPVRDEVLIFHKAVDYTYLRVLDAVLNTSDWSLYETDKREGLIRAYNLKWADPFAPMEQRVATFYIKRLSRTRTAVELDSASQTLIGVDDLLRSVKEQMNR